MGVSGYMRSSSDGREERGSEQHSHMQAGGRHAAPGSQPSSGNVRPVGPQSSHAGAPGHGAASHSSNNPRANASGINYSAGNGGHSNGGSPVSSLGPDMSRTNELIRVRKKRKSKRARKIILIVVLAIVLVVAAVCVALALYFNSVNSAMSIQDPNEKNALEQALQPAENENTEDQAFYGLILGSDAREGDTASRSDVIILMRVDPANAQVTMVSIPRDTKVEIEGHGTQKINAAYAFGGAAGAVEAVSEFAGVPISHYAELHFEELEQLIDDLGGVWVDVPVSNNQTGASNTGVELEAGEQLLNGEQALAFARERYGYIRGDFQRADNQRLIAEAVMKKILSLSPLEMPGAIQQLAGCITTDLSVNDLIAYAQQFQQAGNVTFYSALVPSSTATIDGVSYVITDEVSWEKMMERVDDGENPSGNATSSDSSDASSANGGSSDSGSQGESGGGE